MKIQSRSGCPSVSAASRILFPAAVLAMAAVPSLAQTNDAPKTHTLFMGADISVGSEKEVYPVTDVNGYSWVVDAHGHEQVISTKEGPLNIKVSPSLKLTEVSATVANLKSERGYTFENDPVTRQTRAMAHEADENIGNHTAVNQAVSGQNNYLRASRMALVTQANQAQVQAGGPSSDAVRQKFDAQAQAHVDSAASSGGSDLEMSGASTAGFDAMDVAFEVSSAWPLNRPYVVTVTRFHPHGANPGVVQNMVYSKSLDPIGAQPTHIHLVEGGFPFGFEVLDFQVHLYDRGQEIATSVSSKRVPLTRDEAFEYVRMEYLGSHRGDTLPAVPAMGKLPADLPARLSEGKYRDTVFVRVSKEGLARGVFADAACSRRISDPYLETVVGDIRFKPALEKGKPVDGVAKFSIADLRF